MSPDIPTSATSVSETSAHRLLPGDLKILRILRRVAQLPADWLTKKLFLEAYEAANDVYWRHHATQCEWRSLDGIIEFSPDLLTMPSEQTAPVYLIAIRATSNVDLRRVVIKVKAKKSGIIHQQEITQNRLRDTPVRKALTEIPLKPKSSKVAGRQELGDIYIRLVKAMDRAGVDLVKSKKIANIFPSSSTDSVPHHQVERWGQYWNIDEINVEKDNIKIRCYRELVQSARQLGRPLTTRRTAYRLLTSHFALALTFWSRNLWNAKGIRASIVQAEVDDRPICSEKRKAAMASQNTAYLAASTEVSS